MQCSFHTTTLNLFFPSVSPFSISLCPPNTQHPLQNGPGEYSSRAVSFLAPLCSEAVPGGASYREFPGTTPTPWHRRLCRLNGSCLGVILFGVTAVFILLVIIHSECTVGGSDNIPSSSGDNAVRTEGEPTTVPALGADKESVLGRTPFPRDVPG